MLLAQAAAWSAQGLKPGCLTRLAWCLQLLQTLSMG